ncbi:SRPBCC family protein [Photobacterium japonica]|uniref:SRPBCC family protein n=1 Tax=Photobacterium japonica TaxID=2910235 RepID=UPI003D1130EE
MGMYSITLEQTANVPKTVLFQLLADHDNLDRFFSGRYTLIRAGKPDTNGIGAIRQVSDGWFSTQEQVIAYKENEHLQYKIIQGGPVKEHGGWIKLQSLSAEHSLIHYRIIFSPKIRGTGWLVGCFFKHRIKKALLNLAAYSELTWQSPSP